MFRAANAKAVSFHQTMGRCTCKAVDVWVLETDAGCELHQELQERGADGGETYELKQVEDLPKAIHTGKTSTNQTVEEHQPQKGSLPILTAKDGVLVL